jgi:hypothetical protein
MLLPSPMQKANHLGRLAFIEVAAHGLPRAFMKLGQAVGLGEDGLADGTSNEAALGRFFDDENDLVHTPHDIRALQEPHLRRRAHRLSHRGRHARAMIPVDLLIAVAPAALWLALSLLDKDAG